MYKLEQFLDGDIDEAVDGLIAADQAAKMKEFG
jgi:peptide chain release factor 1